MKNKHILLTIILAITLAGLLLDLEFIATGICLLVLAVFCMVFYPFLVK